MQPLFSPSKFCTAVQYNASKSRISSRAIKTQQTATGLRHIAYAIEYVCGVEGFGVASSIGEACRLATIECADRCITRILPKEIWSLSTIQRFHDRSLGIGSSTDKSLAREKAQNDWRDKVGIAKCRHESGKHGQLHMQRESFHNGMYTLVLCENGTFGAGSGPKRDFATQHAMDEILLQRLLKLSNEEIPYTTLSSEFIRLSSCSTTLKYYLDTQERYLAIL